MGKHTDIIEIAYVVTQRLCLCKQLWKSFTAVN